MIDLIKEIHKVYKEDVKVWIKFSVDESWDSIQGYIHNLDLEYCTLYTDVGPRSVPYSQILKVEKI